MSCEDVDEVDDDTGDACDTGVDNKVASIALAFPSTDEINASPNSTSPLRRKETSTEKCKKTQFDHMLSGMADN